MESRNPFDRLYDLLGDDAGVDVPEAFLNDTEYIIEPYLCGHIRHTVYGPEEFLADHQKRFRVMNKEEYLKYLNMVKMSKGFDVDGCTGCMPGRIVPVSLTSDWWGYSDAAAQFAVAKNNMDYASELGCEDLQVSESYLGSLIKYKQLIKANVEPIKGVRYYLTFIAVFKGKELLCRARVVDQFWKNYHERLHLESLKVSQKSEKEVEELRLEITKKLTDLATKGFRIPSSELKYDICPREPTYKELRTKAFWMYLNEVKNQNNQWEFFTVRRVAKRKWKKMNSLEQWFYIEKAEEEFIVEQFGLEP